MKSTKPFTETLRSILDMEGISERGLTQRIKERGGHQRSHSTLHRVYAGDYPVILASEEEQGHNPLTLEAIAAALHVRPETFVEYRLWQVRRRFNPKAVGLQEAVRNLQRVEEAEVAGREDTDGPVDPAQLLDSSESTRPSRSDAA